MDLTTLDLDTLRTLITAKELGTLRGAAERARRTPSAISLQMKRLQEEVGVILFRKNGRGVELTEAGETVLRYGQRMLALNDELLDVVRGAALAGTVKVGFSQDFAETVLPLALSRFTKHYPSVQLDVRIEASEDLVAAFEAGALDVVLVLGEADRSSAQTLGMLQLGWIAARDYQPSREQSLSVIMLGPKCIFRQRAIAALEQAAIPWKAVVTCPSVAASWASAVGRLGVMARSRLGLPEALVYGATLFDLPRLGSVPVTMYSRKTSRNQAIVHLQRIMKDVLGEILARLEPS